MAAGLFVLQHGGAEAGGVEIVARRRLLLLGVEREDAGRETGADDLALGIAPVGIEAIADHRLAVAHHVGDDCHRAHGHLAEIDHRVAHGRAHGDARLANFGDAHSQAD